MFTTVCNRLETEDINYCSFFKWNFHLLVYTRLELLNSPSPLSDSPFHDVPYVFNRRQIWTAGRPVKHTHKQKHNLSPQIIYKNVLLIPSQIAHDSMSTPQKSTANSLWSLQIKLCVFKFCCDLRPLLWLEIRSLGLGVKHLLSDACDWTHYINF